MEMGKIIVIINQELYFIPQYLTIQHVFWGCLHNLHVCTTSVLCLIAQ